MSPAKFTACSSGRLIWDKYEMRCALGKSGVVAGSVKREGDGASPAGTWPLRRLLYRPDREAPPRTRLALAPLSPNDGWCDDPKAGLLYNRPVRLPCPFSHEILWRHDQLYDLLVVLGYNDDPPVLGHGSAIFLHIAHPDYAPTEGCVALSRADLLTILLVAAPGDALRIAHC